MQSTDRVLIVGGNSDIGKGLYTSHQQQGHVVRQTSRIQGAGDYLLDLRVPETHACLGASMFERVYYCIGIGQGTAADMWEMNARLALDFVELLARRVEPGGKLVVLSTHLASASFLRDTATPDVLEIARRSRNYLISRSAFNTGLCLLSRTYDHCRWIIMHPGLVSTKATNYTKSPRAISVETSVAGILATTEKIKMQGPLVFMDFRGNTLTF